MCSPASDSRWLPNGRVIPAERYSDQPYLVRADDGAWVCVLTTGLSPEGCRGQHVVSRRSLDQGRTWQDHADVEPSSGPEASYAVPLKAPDGRIFVFYNYNTANLRTVRADDPPYPGGECDRVDSLGDFVFKVSDDHGRSWPAPRQAIPVRETAIDRANPYRGAVRLFWNVGRPFVHRGAVYVPLHKVAGFGHGFFTRTEGWLLRSDDLLTVSDPSHARWETLPDGETGLTAPPGGGPIAEEQSIAVLSDGGFYAVWRTVDGHPATALSRDAGRTWTEPAYQTFSDGRPMKHPRAANFIWRCDNGRYLYWFHNHGGRDYVDRNPAWICGGIEQAGPDGKLSLAWSQPEILLYDDDPFLRLSYPDLLEENGRVFITETQKAVPRIHEIDPALLAGVWGQFDPPRLAQGTLALEWRRGNSADSLRLGPLPDFLDSDEHSADYRTKDFRSGVTLEFWIDSPQSLAPGSPIASNRSSQGRGFALTAFPEGAVELALSDGRVESRWRSDRGVLAGTGPRHVVAIVDGGPKIILFVVDGRLHDGGTDRQFGWGRYHSQLRTVRGDTRLLLAPAIALARIHARALRVSEALGNYRSGPSS